MKNLNYSYDDFTRTILELNHEGAKMKPEAKRDLRRKLRKKAEPADRVIIYNAGGDSYIIIYKDPFEFDGTREELRAELWDQLAIHCNNYNYDCTAEHFTTDFKIGYMGGNLWKVAEYRSIDV